jgi:hypothetical protein
MTNFPEIQQIVCKEENINPLILQIKTRKRKIVFTRQVIMYFMKKYTKESLDCIGSHFKSEKSESGHLDHATVLHACALIDNLIWSDKDIRIKINYYENRIKGLERPKNTNGFRYRWHLMTAITNGSPIRRETVVIYNKLIEK